MIPLFDAPPGYRFVKEGEPIEVGDIVCTDFGDCEFKIGPNHREVGMQWDPSCLTLLRPTTQPKT